MISPCLTYEKKYYKIIVPGTENKNRGINNTLVLDKKANIGETSYRLYSEKKKKFTTYDLLKRNKYNERMVT